MDISLSGGRLWEYTAFKIIGQYTPITTSKQGDIWFTSHKNVLKVLLINCEIIIYHSIIHCVNCEI